MKRIAVHLLMTAALAGSLPATSRADPLLDEVVNFQGAIAWLAMGQPGYVLAAVRNGETAFLGLGETSDGSGTAPTLDTMMRIGSLSKVFCGEVLADLVAEGTVGLTDPLQDYLADRLTAPEKDGRPIRLIDLVTHAAGFPREGPFEFGPREDPFSTNDLASQERALAMPLLFAPGTGVVYSNLGFDFLGGALATAAERPYAELLRERVLDPLGMDSTRFTPLPEDEGRLMQGHFVDGAAMPFVPTPETIECAGGLYTSAGDMQKWMLAHLAEIPDETLLLDHAAWLQRDGLDPAAGFDEGGGDMDALGLGWVVMRPEGTRPLILQKTGGLQGMFAYVAFAPGRGMGVFTAINEMNIGAFATMVHTAVGLLTEMAPR